MVLILSLVFFINSKNYLREVSGHSENFYDTEYPSTTRTDTPSPPQAPSGPMTRARARNIENEVTSFLFESRLGSCENWILPSLETL